MKITCQSLWLFGKFLGWFVFTLFWVTIMNSRGLVSLYFSRHTLSCWYILGQAEITFAFNMGNPDPIFFRSSQVNHFVYSFLSHPHVFVELLLAFFLFSFLWFYYYFTNKIDYCFDQILYYDIWYFFKIGNAKIDHWTCSQVKIFGRIWFFYQIS